MPTAISTEGVGKGGSEIYEGSLWASMEVSNKFSAKQEMNESQTLDTNTLERIYVLAI